VLLALGQVFLFAVVVVLAAVVLARVMSAAFPPGGSSPRRARTGRAMRSPASRAVGTAGRSVTAAAAHPRNSQIRAQARADGRRAWTDVKSADWLEQRRHDREHGTETVTAPKTLRQRLRLAPFTPPSAAGGAGNGTNGTNGANGTSHPDGANGTNGTAPAPPPQPSAPAPPASTNGGTPMGTSTASAEKLIEGINEIYAHAAAGGINAKQEAIKAAHEACTRFAGMAQMLARTMSEPGSNYGPEITEPCAKAGQHLQAASMAWAEADSAITTLKNMTVGDLSKSPRQAPHNRELSENGAR
jgi:hypothetical protein